MNDSMNVTKFISGKGTKNEIMYNKICLTAAVIVMMLFLIGCGESRLPLNGIGKYEVYNDAVKIIQKEYPHVEILSTEDDAIIEKYSDSKSERGFAVTIIVDENGKQQAILMGLFYRGAYYGDDTRYSIVLKTDVDNSHHSADEVEFLAPNTSMSKEELYYLSVKAIAEYLGVSEMGLLLDSTFPGIDQCGLSGAKDGGTYMTFPVDYGTETIVVTCEIYEDGTCIVLDPQ